MSEVTGATVTVGTGVGVGVGVAVGVGVGVGVGAGEPIQPSVMADPTSNTSIKTLINFIRYHLIMPVLDCTRLLSMLTIKVCRSRAAVTSFISMERDCILLFEYVLR
jgi:hypothetical protein